MFEPEARILRPASWGAAGTSEKHREGVAPFGRAFSPTDQLCTVSVENPPLVVGEVSIWASYSCPALTSDDNTSILCDEDVGWFFFDHCK